MKKNIQELRHFHLKLKKILEETMHLGFEVTLAVFRRLIRTDYHSIALDDIPDLISEDIESEMITIRIDTQTAKSVYKKIIDDIYQEVEVTKLIKDTVALSKENKLILLFDINYYKQYENLNDLEILEMLKNPILSYDKEKPYVFNYIDLKLFLEIIEQIQEVEVLKKTNFGKYISNYQ